MFEVSNQVPVNNPLPPTGGNTTVPQTGTTPDTVNRTDTFSQVGGIVGATVAGGAASFKYSATFSSTLKSTIANVKATEGGFGAKVKATMPGVKTLGITTLKAGGISALISGAASAITNGIEVLQGKKTSAEAIGTFAADTASGTIAGMAGVATGGLATMAFGSMLGATPLLIVGVGVGALGALLSDRLFKGSGAYDAIRNSMISTTSQK